MTGVLVGVAVAFAVLLWPARPRDWEADDLDAVEAPRGKGRWGLKRMRLLGDRPNAPAVDPPGARDAADARDARGERAAHDVKNAPFARNAADVTEALVLLNLALRGGRAPVPALESVADLVGGVVGRDLRAVAAGHHWGLPAEVVWAAVPPVWSPAAVAWIAAERAGVSPGPLLERAAVGIRAQAAAERESALQRAAVLLVLPLGVAFLPGFVATTVAPTIWRLLPMLLGP